ncbi:hypothetical protein HU200_063237 [Digitaria exilis]|uniref:FLZ-type domain-containing protein n=1 Tax=Digitaria exilis TaxID=1010633 RepID=A0A835DWJ1_9POAL|nr:hypothetical protein HU200_063237 [Digitaria exilis]
MLSLSATYSLPRTRPCTSRPTKTPPPFFPSSCRHDQTSRFTVSRRHTAPHHITALFRGLVGKKWSTAHELGGRDSEVLVRPVALMGSSPAPLIMDGFVASCERTRLGVEGVMERRDLRLTAGSQTVQVVVDDDCWCWMAALCAGASRSQAASNRAEEASHPRALTRVRWFRLAIHRPRGRHLVLQQVPKLLETSIPTEAQAQPRKTPESQGYTVRWARTDPNPGIRALARWSRDATDPTTRHRQAGPAVAPAVDPPPTPASPHFIKTTSTSCLPFKHTEPKQPKHAVPLLPRTPPNRAGGRIALAPAERGGGSRRGLLFAAAADGPRPRRGGAHGQSGIGSGSGRDSAFALGGGGLSAAAWTRLVSSGVEDELVTAAGGLPLGHFLESCFLCRKPLASNRDIFMYRFAPLPRPCAARDIPFCTEECRREQIEMDEEMERKESSTPKKVTTRAPSHDVESPPRPPKARAGSILAG